MCLAMLNHVFGAIRPFFDDVVFAFEVDSQLPPDVNKQHLQSRGRGFPKRAYLFMSAEHFTSASSKRRPLYFAEVLLLAGLTREEDEERKPKHQTRHQLLMTLDLETGQKWH